MFLPRRGWWGFTEQRSCRGWRCGRGSREEELLDSEPTAASAGLAGPAPERHWPRRILPRRLSLAHCWDGSPGNVRRRLWATSAVLPRAPRVHNPGRVETQGPPSARGSKSGRNGHPGPGHLPASGPAAVASVFQHAVRSRVSAMIVSMVPNVLVKSFWRALNYRMFFLQKWSLVSILCSF